MTPPLACAYRVDAVLAEIALDEAAGKIGADLADAASSVVEHDRAFWDALPRDEADWEIAISAMLWSSGVWRGSRHPFPPAPAALIY
jgi:hypothetical protein